jgi:hypothetical protein
MSMTTDNTKQEILKPKSANITYVTLSRTEVIEMLKALEGLKQKLQPLLKNNS